MTNRARTLFGLLVVSVCLLNAHVHEESSTAVGVKTLSVKSDSVAAKAGIQPGDTILAWRQADAGGLIASPFEYEWMQNERAPRGPVTLTGLHHGEKLNWTLSGDDWGITSGVVWPEVQAVIDRLNSFANAKQVDSLVQYCRTACNSLPTAGSRRSYAFYQAATLLVGMEHLKEADEFFNSALKDSQPKDKPESSSCAVTQIYDAWGVSYFEANQWKPALTYNEKALAASRAISANSLNTARYLYLMAGFKLQLGEYKQAKEYALQALKIRKALAPQSMSTARSFSELGKINFLAEDLAEAERWHRESLELALKIKPVGTDTAKSYGDLGAVYGERGDYLEGEKYLLNSLEIQRQLPENDSVLATLFSNLGLFAFTRGNEARAEYCYRKALLYREKQGVKGEEYLAHALRNLAELKDRQGDPASARPLFQRALSIEERIEPNDDYYASALLSYGSLLRDQRQFQDAETFVLKAVAICRNINNQSLNYALSRFQLGKLYMAEGKYQEAEKEHMAAAEIRARLAPHTIWHGESLGALADVEAKLGRNALAMNYYAKTIQIFDRRASELQREDSLHFGETYPDYSGKFAALLLAGHQPRHAFEVLDHSRAQTLTRTLAAGRVNLKRGIPAALLDKDQKIETQLANLADERLRILSGRHSAKAVSAIDEKIAEADADHDFVERQMRLANPSYSALTQPHKPSLLQIQQALGADTVLLEYYFGEERSLLFAVTQDGLSSFQLPAYELLDKLVHDTYSLWSKPQSKPDALALSQQLSDAALGPALGALQGRRRLLVVAHGSLQYIPFAALPMPKHSAHSGQPLAAQFEVVNLPSASLLLMLRRHATPNPNRTDSIAIIGDPVFTREDPRVIGARSENPALLTASARSADVNTDPSVGDKDEEAVLLQHDDDEDAPTRGLELGRLIHSREEAEAIASVSPKDRLLMALDFDANRSIALNPKVAQSRIVHFATHGVFDSKNPARSGLVLSLVDKQGHPQSGFLALDDIYRAHFTADLVVASACETALGEEITDEGFVGLTWGFIYAGAKTVVASLWRVNDASTAELMRLFYSGIEQHGLKPAAALREAQLAISRKPEWSSPYYWAGFVIEGEYR